MSTDQSAAPKQKGKAMDPRDLEALETTLVLAGICLTNDPAARFTEDLLIAHARHISPKARIRDLRIVLKAMRFFKRLPGGLLALR